LIEKLNMRKIMAAKAPCKLLDGGGLLINKRAGGSAQFSFRYTLKGRTRELGLGGLGSMTLKRAREIASDYRANLAESIDPAETRDQAALPLKKIRTVEEICNETFEVIKPTLQDAGADKWFSQLKNHVIPKIGGRDIETITRHDVVAILEPLWGVQKDTPIKLCTRLQRCFEHASAHGLKVDLTAIENAKILLGPVIMASKPHQSMPYNDVPEFYRSLASDSSTTALAMRFTILTALRSNSVRNARFEYINNAEQTITIPKIFMKARKGLNEDFTVPISDELANVIELCRERQRLGYLFYGSKGLISDNTVGMYLRRRELPATAHGFRTTLRTWLAENRAIPDRRDVFETMLAHKVSGNKIERTYNRALFIDERREYGKLWSNYVTSKL
jgi:integrase